MVRNKNLIYIAEGFNEDCGILIDTLIHKYNRLDWHKFCYHWKEMEFDKLFFGRQSGSELVELTEEYLQVARLYIVTETDNFERQVAGVFIAYALTVIQPYNDLCVLRIVPVDAYPLKRIEAIARRNQRLDIIVALGKLYLYHTEFHVSLRERSVDKPMRKYFESSLNVPKCISRRWHGNLGRVLLGKLDKLTADQDEYAGLKAISKAMLESRIPGTHVQVDIFQPPQPSMADTFRTLTEGTKDEDKEEEDTKITAIKKKAMKNVVDPMKHLQCITDRKKKNEKIVISLSPSKAKARNRRLKLMSLNPADLPPPTPIVSQSLSLPALDAEIEPTSGRKNSPEATFRGFTELELESTQTVIKQPAVVNIEKSVKTTSPLKDKSSPPKDKLSPFKDKLSPPKDKSPRSIRKAVKKRKGAATKRKKTLKNKNNKKLKVTNDFNSGSDSSIGSSSDDSFMTDYENAIDDLADLRTYKAKLPTLQSKPVSTNLDEDPSLQAIYKTYTRKKRVQNVAKTCAVTEPTPTQSDIKTHEGKELTLQTVDGAKQFVEFEISNVVITSEKDMQPGNDIEIELIDNYNTGNAGYEAVCDVSDGENNKDNNEEVEVVIEPIDVSGDANDDAIEVFQIIDSDAQSEDDNSDETIKQEMVKIISKDKMNKEKVDQRHKLKQPNLRSKFKKLGLLNVASFD